MWRNCNIIFAGICRCFSTRGICVILLQMENLVRRELVPAAGQQERGIAMPWDLEDAMAYYQEQGAPGDQSALISLLREVQREQGGSLPRHALTAIAEGYGVKETLLLALVKRIPSLRLGEAHVLELCAGPNCGKHAALAAFAEKTCGGRPDITVKFVPCMRMCGKGPNIKWDGKLYHQADEALLRCLTEKK